MSRWRDLRTHDQADFEAFVRQHGDALNALARGLAKDSNDASDLMQESLAKLLERWERVSGADEPYLYARRLMVNASISFWRKSRKRESLLVAEKAVALHGERSLLWRAGNLDHAGATDERLSLLHALRALAPRQRAVLSLRYLEDLPDDQIAALLGVSQVTVRSTALRALRIMKSRMDSDSTSGVTDRSL